MEERIIFHIDVNNAFLSWTAVKLLQEGSKVDIRKIPSVIGGNEQERKGIVLQLPKNIKLPQLNLSIKPVKNVLG